VLHDRGDEVGGLVRRPDQQDAFDELGIRTVVGSLADMDAPRLAASLDGVDALVFAAGSNAADRAVTDAVDGAGVTTALAASRLAHVRRFLLVSVMPEAWRERDLGDDEEHYFAVKKRAEVEVSRSDLDWVVLRPSLLTDDSGVGTVDLGPAAIHTQVSRDDVAATVAALLSKPRVSRQVLELDAGTTLVADAVHALVPRSVSHYPG
jgi:uncharacterized protein YbjT (DUF2867 family)